MEIGLNGKVALVTGASRGIGRAIAAEFAASGASVMISSRKRDALEAAAATMDGEVAVHAAHAGDLEAADACVAATIERFGGLDILVNNAATNPYYGPTLGIDPSRYDKTFEVNLRGPLFWCQSAWERSMKERPGVIVNIASVGGLRAEGFLGVYNVTKAALIHLTRQLAGELGPTRVVGIAPGLVKTDFAQVLVDNFGEAVGRQPAGAAVGGAGGHRPPGHLPGQRRRQLDHRGDLRHRRRRRGPIFRLSSVSSSPSAASLRLAPTRFARRSLRRLPPLRFGPSRSFMADLAREPDAPRSATNGMRGAPTGCEGSDGPSQRSWPIWSRLTRRSRPRTGCERLRRAPGRDGL